MVKNAAILAFIVFQLVMNISCGQLPDGLKNREYKKLSWIPERIKTETLQGRNVVRFENECPTEWNYKGAARQYFYVAEPVKKTGKHPLLVCLHSAGGTGESEMTAYLKRIADAGDDFVGLMPNSKFENDWWWGDELIKKDPNSYNNELTPAEKRVLGTIEWVVQNYDIDRNRIYLYGISMGGSGALGIGMAHGDIFAAVLAGVPAGSHHMLFRERLSGDKSPPPALVFFSQKDSWAKEMGQMIDAVKRNKYGFVYAWGPWGHINHYEMTTPAAYEYPWLSIRRDQAYPVFTNTSCDNIYPGYQSDAPDANGQVNAYFRWTNVKDTPDEFIMELRLVAKEEVGEKDKIPDKAVTDITLRRLQYFRVLPDKKYTWSLEQVGHEMGTGEIAADERGLITINNVAITHKPVWLIISPGQR